MTASISKIYDNCLMLSKEGEKLAYCSLARMNWYLNKGLAEKVDELTIKLFIEPKGKNYKKGLLVDSPRENICVVCGKNYDLNRHHIVPSCFRKYFPNKYKNSLSYDIVALCLDCHEKYEKQADEFKKAINSKYSNFELLLENKKNKRVKANLRKLLNGIKIEEDSINEIREKYDYHGDFSIEDIKELEKIKIEIKDVNKEYYMFIAKDLIENSSIEHFIKKWREHFINVMNPRFMPKGWEVGKECSVED